MATEVAGSGGKAGMGSSSSTSGDRHGFLEFDPTGMVDATAMERMSLDLETMAIMVMLGEDDNLGEASLSQCKQDADHTFFGLVSVPRLISVPCLRAMSTFALVCGTSTKRVRRHRYRLKTHIGS